MTCPNDSLAHFLCLQISLVYNRAMFRMRLPAIVFAVISVFLFPACESRPAFAPPPADTAAVSNAVPKVNFVTWNEDYLPALQKEVPVFEKETGIKVEWKLLSEDVIREKVLIDLASGAGEFDLVLTDVWILPEHVASNYLEPLDRFIAEDASFDMSKWYPTFLDALTYEGKLYALPTESFGAALVYRKDLFEKYNVKVPATIAELTAAARKLTLDADGDGRIDVYGVVSRGKAGEEPAIIVSGFASAFGGTWFEKGAATVEEIKKQKAKPAFNSPKFAAGFRTYCDLLKKYGPPGSKDYTWYEIVEDGRKGRAAMILYADFNAGAMDRIDVGMRDKYAAALPVRGPSGYVQEAFAMGYGINKNSKNKEAAWKFLKFITGDLFTRGVVDNYVTSVAMKTFRESEAYRAMHPYKTPDGAYVLEKDLDLIDWRYMPRIPEYSVIANMLGTAASEVIGGKKDAKAALDELNGAVFLLMQRSGYYK